MPIYEYRRPDGTTFEMQQSFSDEPLIVDPVAIDWGADGKLVKPKNYREWIYLSSGLGMQYNEPGAAPNPNPNFENVFVEPSAYRKFVETGRWPDKSVFVSFASLRDEFSDSRTLRAALGHCLWCINK